MSRRARPRNSPTSSGARYPSGAKSSRPGRSGSSDDKPPHYDEAMYTFSLYLQTYKARSPVAIAEGQLDNTAIEHTYLLFSIHRNVRLVDLETGEELLGGLKLAF